MIEEWLTAENKAEIAKRKLNIIVTEFSEEEGKAGVKGVMSGSEAALTFMITSVADDICKRFGRNINEVLDHMRTEYAWMKGHQLMTDIINKVEGGRKK